VPKGGAKKKQLYSKPSSKLQQLCFFL